jgi:hypothetical protein
MRGSGDVIASDSFYLCRPRQKRLRINLTFMAPQQVGPEEWACAVSAPGLLRKKSFHGGTSLQALCLAVAIVLAKTQQARVLGHTFEYADGHAYDFGTLMLKTRYTEIGDV